LVPAAACADSRPSGASLPILVVIYNDAAYGAEVHHFRPMGQAVDLAQFPDTEFAALARAAGCQGITARSSADLEFLRAWLEHRDGPMVLDAKVDPDICAEWLEEAFHPHGHPRRNPCPPPRSPTSSRRWPPARSASST
jgi:hypothetical protein